MYATSRQHRSAWDSIRERIRLRGMESLEHPLKNNLIRIQDTAAEILQELQRQRETIQRATDTVQNTDQEVRGAQKIVSRMGKRAKWWFWP